MLEFGGLFAWGYLCGRVRDKLASLLLVPSPFLALSIYYPRMFSDIRAVYSLSGFFLLFVAPGYLVGFFNRRGKSKGSVLETEKTERLNISVILRFLVFILYATVFFVSWLDLFGYSFPTGYYFATIYVAIAAVAYVFLRKRIRRTSTQ